MHHVCIYFFICHEKMDFSKPTTFILFCRPYLLESVNRKVKQVENCRNKMCPKSALKQNFCQVSKITGFK